MNNIKKTATKISKQNSLPCVSSINVTKICMITVFIISKQSRSRVHISLFLKRDLKYSDQNPMNHKCYCLEALQAIITPKYNNFWAQILISFVLWRYLFDWLSTPFLHCPASFLSRFNRTSERRYALEIERKFVKRTCAQTTHRVQLIFWKQRREKLSFRHLKLGEYRWKHVFQQIFPAHRTVYFPQLLKTSLFFKTVDS